MKIDYSEGRLELIANQLAAARCPEDVFGPLQGGDDQQHQLAVRYRRIVQVVHPDKHHGSDIALAETAFTTLKNMREHAERKIAAGAYGDHKPLIVVPTRPKLEPQVITTPKGDYVVDGYLAEGDLSAVYRAEHHERRSRGRSETVAFKLAHHPGDNDLLEHEAKILSSIWPNDAKSEGGRRFIPQCTDTFLLRGASRSQRRVNVLSYASGHVSLAEIIAAYPRGLDFRDVVWMFKRLLYSLWFTHTEAGIVHGAVLPPHVLVHPIDHGAKLVDWCYAVPQWFKGESRVRAISTPHRAFYAPEILAKQPPVPATDIYMAAKCAVALLGGHVDTNVMPSTVPAPIQGFLRSCLLAAPSRRPDDAGALHEEFDELLLRLVGKPTYRPLAMPGK